MSIEDYAQILMTNGISLSPTAPREPIPITVDPNNPLLALQKSILHLEWVLRSFPLFEALVKGQMELDPPAPIELPNTLSEQEGLLRLSALTIEVNNKYTSAINCFIKWKAQIDACQDVYK